MSASDIQITIGADASGVKSGLDQAKAAVADFAPTIEALGKSAGELGSQFKEGFEGVQSLTSGLQSAGVAGSEGLSGLAEAGGGFAQILTGIVEATHGAAAAMAEWASRTLASDTASDEAKQNAAALNQAIGGAGASFGAIGDTIADAFAPAVTTVATALAGLIQGFSAMAVAVAGVAAALDAWSDRFQITKDGVLGAVEVLQLGFQALGRVAKQTLSGDISAAADDYEQNLLEMQRRTQAMVTAVSADFAKLKSDQLDMNRELANTGAATIRDDGPALTGSPGAAPPPYGQGSRASRGSEPELTQPAPCPPNACVTQAAQDQQSLTAISLGGALARQAANAETDQAIIASNQDVTRKAVDLQSLQVEAAQSADRAKVASGHSATDEIIDDNDRALRAFKSSMDALVSSFSKGLTQMVMGGRSFAQVMHTLGEQVLNDFFKIVDAKVEKWAWGVTENVLSSTEGQAVLKALGLTNLAQDIAIDTKRTASKAASATAQKGVAATAQTAGLASDAAYATAEKAINAQTAFSGAIAAISPIPFIGPEIAPGIAAQMAALASAAGGFDIPSGVNPLTQLHAREMVLPARLANPMRAMMDDYAAAKVGPWGGSAQPAGGDTHIHNYTISAMDAGSFKAFLRGNKNPLSTVLQEMGRAGMKTA